MEYSKEKLRNVLHDNLDTVVGQINIALHGGNLSVYETVLKRLARGKLPHWYNHLQSNGELPNLDGKTVGSVVEMLLVAVLENGLFKDFGIPPLKINPARGVDLPDLDLGVKSPSKNFCTSEPFFSAYERLLGSEFDVIVLITDYQIAKKHPPLKLQIIESKYLIKTQIADMRLCRVALKHKDWLIKEDEARAKKFFRFLAYVNQSDFRAKHLLNLVEHMQDDKEIEVILKNAQKKFKETNSKNIKKDKALIPDEELNKLQNILNIKPSYIGILDATENWVIDVHQDLAQIPSQNEWNRLLASPLNGLIGMSFALQWRYNFGKLFPRNPLIKDDSFEFEDD